MRCTSPPESVRDWPIEIEITEADLVEIAEPGCGFRPPAVRSLHPADAAIASSSNKRRTSVSGSSNQLVQIEPRQLRQHRVGMRDALRPEARARSQRIARIVQRAKPPQQRGGLEPRAVAVGACGVGRGTWTAARGCASL